MSVGCCCSLPKGIRSRDLDTHDQPRMSGVASFLWLNLPTRLRAVKCPGKRSDPGTGEFPAGVEIANPGGTFSVLRHLGSHCLRLLRSLLRHTAGSTPHVFLRRSSIPIGDPGTAGLWPYTPGVVRGFRGRSGLSGPGGGAAAPGSGAGRTKLFSLLDFETPDVTGCGPTYGRRTPDVTPFEFAALFENLQHVRHGDVLVEFELVLDTREVG